MRLFLQVEETLNQRTELLSSYYLSTKKDHVNEALRLIQTMRLRKFKGSRTEMCLLRVIFSHSPNLERMIIEQEIKLEGFAVTKMPEMQLMELLLAKSPMLVRMLIKLDRTVAESARAKILARVSKIKSASPKAEVEVIF
ncbi:hypothetical protein H5410_026001 [Solanum commersonii]|uniref:Uncharacterized protein n=1 Tax=Solanum commersonii TaxID=4109 RepID=A0A9J5YXG7_SOLCO|nr:hypothetical protein H5410_026001 [Solanum commersonii]